MYHTEYIIYDPRRPLVESQLQLTSLHAFLDSGGAQKFPRGELTVTAVKLDAESAQVLGESEGALALLPRAPLSGERPHAGELGLLPAAGRVVPPSRPAGPGVGGPQLSPPPLKSLRTALIELDESRTLDLTRRLLAQGRVAPVSILSTCQQALKVVGERYERQEYFLSGLIMAGELFKEVLDLVQPAQEQTQPGTAAGTVVLGTVAGDIHDIGKNMFATSLRGFDFKVIDLGVDVSPERFLAEVGRSRPDVVCLSGLDHGGLREHEGHREPAAKPGGAPGLPAARSCSEGRSSTAGCASTRGPIRGARTPWKASASVRTLSPGAAPRKAASSGAAWGSPSGRQGILSPSARPS